MMQKRHRFNPKLLAALASTIGAFMGATTISGGMLTLTGNTLNMLSMIGLILLFGLVGKPAILLVVDSRFGPVK